MRLTLGTRALVTTMSIRGVVQVGILYGPTLKLCQLRRSDGGDGCVPEIGVRFVCLHDLCGEQEENPYTAICQCLIRDRANSSYLAPMTMVLLLKTNFSSNV